MIENGKQHENVGHKTKGPLKWQPVIELNTFFISKC